MAKQQRAQLKYAKITPRKLRLVSNAIKGLTVNEAEAQLSVSPRRAAKVLLKLLQSAIADAKNTQHLQPESLVVHSIQVDGGPVLKRWLPRARGSATPILKRTSHVTLFLKESEKAMPSRFKQKTVVKIKEPEKEQKAEKKSKEF